MLVSTLPSGKHRIVVHKLDPDFFVRWSVCETAYPVDLIRQIFEVKGPGWLCDEIARDESSDYTGAALKWQLLSYVGEEQFENARILDFGCGSGASTSNLSRMFPSAKIVGIELEQDLLSIARSRAKYYELDNVELYLSENSEEVRDDLGLFDHIIMTGVFEHLVLSNMK